MIEKIKSKKQRFKCLCQQNDLDLNYRSNKNEFNILTSIFTNREYSDYFPFYKKATILDIGAHYGYFSIFSSRNTAENSLIIAVEPSENNFENLQKNLNDCDIKNVISHKCALGGKNGKAELFHGKNPNHSIIDTYPLIIRKTNSLETNLITLEELILKHELDTVDFLKMDCEGAEFSILENTPSYIFDRISTISMEFHDLKDPNFTAEVLISKLLKNGFQIVKFMYEQSHMNLNYGKIIGTKLL